MLFLTLLVKALPSTVSEKVWQETCLWGHNPKSTSLGLRRYEHCPRKPLATNEVLLSLCAQNGSSSCEKSHLKPPQTSWENEDRLSIPLTVFPHLGHFQFVHPYLPFRKAVPAILLPEPLFLQPNSVRTDNGGIRGRHNSAEHVTWPPEWHWVNIDGRSPKLIPIVQSTQLLFTIFFLCG